MSTATDAPRIVLLAAKDLTFNTRVHRQAATLARAGWRVTVAALAPPVAELRAQAPHVHYLTLRLPHPLQALSRRLSRPDKDRAPRGASAAPGAPRPLATLGWLRRLALPWGELITRLLFTRACLAALGEQPCDLVQAHDSPALRAACALARRHRARLVYDGVEVVDGRAVFARGALARALRRCESWYEARLIRRADLVITIGPALQAWMTRRYGIAPPRVLRNCREWQPAPQARRLRELCALPAQARLVLFANSIAPDAGIEVLIDALALLPADVHVALLGPLRDPGYRAALLTRATRRGVEARLHLPPPCRADEVVAMFAGADVGVIPLQNTRANHYLALPNRLFEMIMARVPVVVAAFPDLTALVAEHDIGLACACDDPESVAQALATLLTPARRATLSERLEAAAHVLCWEREAAAYPDWLATLLPAARD
ncbi:MAG: glycosyltransferase [Gammaproteobacteria bacterium]